MENYILILKLIFFLLLLDHGQAQSPIVCPLVESLENGYIDDFSKDEFPPGTVIQFVCDLIYKLSDLSLEYAKCSDTGKWSEFPTCEVQFGCSFRRIIPNTFCGYTNDHWRRYGDDEGFNGEFNYRAYLDSSSGGSLTSRSYTVGEQGVYLTFYYRILESNVATFSVIQQNSNGSGSPRTLFSTNKATDWKFERLDLVATGAIKWSFQVSPQAANIQLDEIEVKEIDYSTTSSVTTAAPTTTATVSTSVSDNTLSPLPTTPKVVAHVDRTTIAVKTDATEKPEDNTMSPLPTTPKVVAHVDRTTIAAMSDATEKPEDNTMSLFPTTPKVVAHVDRTTIVAMSDATEKLEDNTTSPLTTTPKVIAHVDRTTIATETNATERFEAHEVSTTGSDAARPPSSLYTMALSGLFSLLLTSALLALDDLTAPC